MISAKKKKTKALWIGLVCKNFASFQYGAYKSIMTW